MSTGNQGQQDPRQPQTGVPLPDPARPLTNTGNPAAVQRPGRQAAGRVAVQQGQGQATGQQTGQQTSPPFQAFASGGQSGGQPVPDLNALRGEFEAALQARLNSGDVLPVAAPGAPQPQQLNFEQIKPYIPIIFQTLQDLYGRITDLNR
jgi:hypothetical protein